MVSFFSRIKYLFQNFFRIILTFVYPKGIRKKVYINDVILTYNAFDKGGVQYETKIGFEETSSMFYSLINSEVKPKVVLDIGANYGFISCIYAKNFPKAQIIAVEPVSFLNEYLKTNLMLNNVNNVSIIQAICGDKINKEVSFSVNPVYSQDSRVSKGAFYWRNENIGETTIDELTKDVTNEEGVFIKIDTQGFEPNVMKGGESFFTRNKNWILKMEFSPYHLEFQGFSPHEFLVTLINKYDVFEDVGRVEYKLDTLDLLFRNKLKEEDVDSFLTYIRSRNSNEKGWTDLLLKSKLI